MPPQLRLPKHKKQTRSHTRSRLQEQETAARHGGSLIPRSGAGDDKGDVRVKRVMRIECKATSNKSFSVTRAMIRTIEDAALASGELPAIHIEFLTPSGEVEQECCVVPRYVLDMICANRV